MVGFLDKLVFGFELQAIRYQVLQRYSFFLNVSLLLIKNFDEVYNNFSLQVTFFSLLI